MIGQPGFRCGLKVERLWHEYWPQRGRAQTGDGVAKLQRLSGTEWVLVEAKANTVEFVTPPCGASKGEAARKSKRRWDGCANDYWHYCSA